LINKRIVFFDWNGTFLDDEVASVEAFRAVLRGVGHEYSELSTDELTALHRQVFEIPLSKMYDSIGFTDKQKQLNSEKHFWSESYKVAAPSMKTHIGINESLQILKEHDIGFGILSNHTAREIEDRLQGFGFSNIPVLANDDNSQAHTHGKLHRVENYQTQHPDIEILAIVGDTAEEVNIAKTIDVASIAFTNGEVLADRIKPSNPDYLINSSELPSIIKAIISV